MTPDNLRLPPELWLEVFEWATIDLDALFSTVYQPFQSASTSLDQDQRRGLLKRRLILALVCRQWRALVTPLLLETLHVGKQSLQPAMHKVQVIKDSGIYRVRRTHPYSLLLYICSLWSRMHHSI
jgi:hypothetical protein